MKTKSLSLIEPLEARIAPALTAATVSLGTLTGNDGFTIKGGADFDEAGTSVSDAGDVNGDGFDDLIVGARFANEGGDNRGAAYVLFGSYGGQGNFPAAFDLGSLGERGYEIIGVADTDFTGQSVHGAGDVNGDGFDDLIVGAQYADEGGNNRGAAYVVFGHAGFGPDVTLATLNGTNGFKLQGVADGDNAGRAVSAAGDVNHDGYADLLVGAPETEEGGTNRGAAYVVFGAATWNATFNLGGINFFTGFKIPGVSDGQKLGTALSGAGDVNGDGFDDVIIGSPFAAGGGTTRGASYVIFGKADGLGPSFDITTLNGNNGFVIQGAGDADQSGSAVSTAGDVNGDSYADVIVGAQLTGGVNDIGAAYVVFGKPSGFGGTLSVGSLNGDNGFSLTGVTKNTGTGSSVSGAGDMNGDGYGDLLVGAQEAGGGAAGSGVSYVMYGKADNFSANVPLSTLDGQNGFRLTGIDTNDNSGRSVSGAGDINGDGYADIIIGAPKADAGSSNLGSAYVVFGGATGTQVVPDFSADHKTATFTDLDGDLVTVKVSKGMLSAAQFNLLQPANADGARFLSVNMGASQALGNVTITAVPTAAGGNGLVELGSFNSNGVDLGAVKIGGNVEAFKIGDAANATPAVKSLTVQSLGQSPLPAHDTGVSQLSGTLNGEAGSITIKGDLDGVRLSVGGLASFTVGGSIVGGRTEYSGGLHSSGDIGTVKIGHDIIGRGHNTGYVDASGTMKSLTIGGSIIGGTDKQSGTVYGATGIGSVILGRDLQDGTIGSNQSIGKVTIGGSIRVTHHGKYSGVFAQGSLGSILVKGDLDGMSDSRVLLFGRGPDIAGSQTNLAIAKVTVLGSATNADILAGYDPDAVAVDGHSQIGKISVGGNWTAGSIATGIKIGNAPDFTHFGNADDALSAGGQSSAVARIASIVIKGAVKGTAGGNDHYGFVAHAIGALKVGAVKYALKKGASDTIALGSTPDFKLLEV